MRTDRHAITHTSHQTPRHTALALPRQTLEPNQTPARPLLPEVWEADSHPTAPLHTSVYPRGQRDPRKRIPAGLFTARGGGGRAGFWGLMTGRPSSPPPGRHANTPAPYPTYPAGLCTFLFLFTQTLAYTRQSFTRFPTPHAAIIGLKCFHSCAPPHVCVHTRCTCVVSLSLHAQRFSQSIFKAHSHGTHVCSHTHTHTSLAPFGALETSEPSRGPKIPFLSLSQAQRCALSPGHTRYTLGRTLFPASRR